MSDPTRLVDEGAAFESGLLGAWQARQPTEMARAKTLAAVGVAGVMALTSPVVAGGSSIVPKAVVASSSVAKWLSILGGASSVALAVGYLSLQPSSVVASRTAGASTVTAASALATESPPPPTSPSDSSPLPTVTAHAAARLRSPATLPAPSISSSAASSAASSGSSSATSARSQVASPPVASPPVAPRSASSSLEDEIAGVDAARRTLTAGDPRGALALLDDYDAKYPRGALAQEAAEVRIEALARAGRREEAAPLAERFLSMNPTSPYARVVRGLFPNGSPPHP